MSRDPLVAGAAAGAIVLAEGLIAQDHALAGQVVDAVAVLALVNLDLVPGICSARARHAVQALVPVAMLRVLSLSLPLRGWDPALARLAMAAACAYMIWRAAPALGASELPRRLASRFTPSQVVVAVGGGAAVLGFVAYAAGAPTTLAGDRAGGQVALGAIAVLVAGLVEEVLYRGLVQPRMVDAYGRAGLVLVAGLHGVAYAGFGSIDLVLVMSAASLLLGCAVLVTGSLGTALFGRLILVGTADVVWPGLLGADDVVQPTGLTTAVLVSLVAGALAGTWRSVPSRI